MSHRLWPKLVKDSCSTTSMAIGPTKFSHNDYRLTCHLWSGTIQLHLAHGSLAWCRSWPTFSLKAKSEPYKGHTTLIGNQACIYGPFSIGDWKLGALGYKRYAWMTCIPDDYCLHPHKNLSMSSNVTNTYSVDAYSVCVFIIHLMMAVWLSLLERPCFNSHTTHWYSLMMISSTT